MSQFIRFALVALVGVLVTMAPDLAHAGGVLDTTIGKGICNVVASMTGPVGKAVATLAVLFLGVGAFFGKVNWGLAVMVGAGLIAIFGAAVIVNNVAGGAACV